MEYARSGRVVWLDVAAGNDRIAASVRGTSAVPYEVAIDWREGERRLRSVCDCPIGRSCKHGAAAAILAAEGGMRDAADGAVDSWLQSITARPFEGAAREHVLYVLDVRESYYVPRVDLAPRVITLLKDGEARWAARSIYPTSRKAPDVMRPRPIAPSEGSRACGCRAASARSIRNCSRRYSICCSQPAACTGTRRSIRRCGVRT